MKKFMLHGLVAFFLFCHQSQAQDSYQDYVISKSDCSYFSKPRAGKAAWRKMRKSPFQSGDNIRGKKFGENQNRVGFLSSKYPQHLFYTQAECVNSQEDAPNRDATTDTTEARNWSIGLGLGYLSNEKALDIVGSLERSLGERWSIGLWGGYIFDQYPIDASMRAGMSLNIFALPYWYFGALGSLQYTKVLLRNGTNIDWYANIGGQSGLRFDLGSRLSLGIIYQLFYSIDFSRSSYNTGTELSHHGLGELRFKF